MITVYDMGTWETLERDATPRPAGGMRLPGYSEREGFAAPWVEPRLATVAQEIPAERRGAERQVTMEAVLSHLL